MRLIGTLSNESYARRIVSYLKQKGIDTNCEISFDARTGQMSYQLWIFDEDQIAAASADFSRFQKEPSNAEYDASVERNEEVLKEEDEKPIARGASDKRAPLTFAVLVLCAILFFLNGVQELPLLKEGLQNVFPMTPIQIALLYDVPPVIDALEEMIEKHAPVSGEKNEYLAPEIQARIAEIEEMPFWRGAYDWVILKMKGEDTSLAEGPLFLR